MLKLLGVIFVALNLLDLLLTITLMNHYQCNIEGNPVARFIYETGGVTVLSAFKLGFVFFVLCLVRYIASQKRSYGLFVMVFGCLALSLTVGYSAILAAEAKDDRPHQDHKF